LIIKTLNSVAKEEKWTCGAAEHNMELFIRNHGQCEIPRSQILDFNAQVNFLSFVKFAATVVLTLDMGAMENVKSSKSQMDFDAQIFLSFVNLTTMVRGSRIIV
jgi:hypothetical protein